MLRNPRYVQTFILDPQRGHALAEDHQHVRFPPGTGQEETLRERRSSHRGRPFGANDLTFHATLRMASPLEIHRSSVSIVDQSARGLTARQARGSRTGRRHTGARRSRRGHRIRTVHQQRFVATLAVSLSWQFPRNGGILWAHSESRIARGSKRPIGTVETSRRGRRVPGTGSRRRLRQR
jgi:hypothetical protein